jgi:fucose permease
VTAQPTTAATPSAPVAVGWRLLLLSYLAFISLGQPDGLLGVGWPSIRITFGVPTEAVGVLLFAGTTGYFVASVLAGFVLARLGVGRLLALSTLAAAVALAGYAISPNLAVMALFGLLSGLGGGAIDSGLNTYAASAFGPRQMNWMHAFFGLGVAIGPLVMTATLSNGHSWRWGYAAVSMAQFLLAIAFLLSARLWTAHRAPTDPTAAPPPRVPVKATLVKGDVWLGVAAFGIYVAVEAGAGLWAFLFLTEGRHLSPAVAGVCVSLYWTGLFVGRVIQGFVAEKWGTSTVLTGSLVGMAVGAVLVALPAPGWVAVTGLILIGFAAAAVFPLLVLNTADRVGDDHTDRTIGLQMGGACVGGVFLPAGIGVLMSDFGVEVLGPSLVVLMALLLACHGIMLRRMRPEATAVRNRGGA